MKTAVTGYPRIGTLRELKFANEKYFRGEITEEELKETAAQIKEQRWKRQKESKIDYISSNDFSYYDTTLDAAVMFGIIPKRYKELKLSKLDTYFSMARGYQKDAGDVKALAMKKWFNTNYHYLVPEVEDDTKICLNDTKFIDEYEQAKSIGIETKPVITGAYTLLKLCRFTGKKKVKDFVEDIKSAYRQVLTECKRHGIKWVQFDEPSLVKDMDDDDIALFRGIYEDILKEKGQCKVLIQTYFGDVRDVYDVLVKLPVDGIGLDFIEGTKTKELVKNNVFLKDKILFAGLVNGKNIWKNHYERTLDTIEELKNSGINVVLSTSCSLLHVPYTIKHETKLDKKYLAYFAFAEEKLDELSELGRLADIKEYKDQKEFIENKQLFEADRNCTDEGVRNRLKNVKESDYIRLPERTKRQALQRKELGLKNFPTTTIGSFPQTADVKKNRTAYRRGEITLGQYKEFNKKKIKECIEFQESIGLDVLVHGEYERNDMVEYFGESLSGFLFTEMAWVQSYGTRCVKPPIIWGDVYRQKPITVEWSVYANEVADKPVKGMLTGPVTILNWSFPREDIHIKESIAQIALAIRDEVLDLEKNGIKIIQIDEAALREKLPLRKSDWNSQYLDFAIPAFRLVHSGVKPDTQIHTHMCYSEFTDIIPAIDDMDADVITFEASRSDLMILDALKKYDFKTEVGPGVYDIHSPRVPSVEELVEAIQKMREKIADDKLWINPDCGLKTRGEKETKESLINMVKAANIIQKM